MARKFLTAVDLTKNELQNAAVQSLASAPASPVKFQLYGNSSDNTLYWWDGTTWIPAKATGGAFPGYGSVPAETTFGIAKSDGAATTVARSDHTHGSPTHSASDHTTIPLNTFAVPTADVSMGGFKITNVGSASATTDAVNKGYVDNRVNGLAWKTSCIVASTGNLTLSGTQTIDGVAVIVGQSVLAKNQTTQSANGIYIVNSGAWTRSPDMDTEGEIPGATTYVTGGTTNQDTVWSVTSPDQIAGFTLGTNNIIWAQTSGPGSVVAGAGMTQSGNTLNVIAGDTSITVAADDIRVNTTWGDARYALLANGMKRYAVNCAAATSTVANHAFNTRDVEVSVYRSTTPWDDVDCDIERTDANNVTVRFNTAPAAGDYRIVVFG